MSAFYTDINLNAKRINDFGFEEVGTLPGAGTTGQHIFLTTTNTVHYWDGSGWIELPGDTTYTATAPIQIDGSNVITIDAATSGTPGSLSAADKTLLDNSTNSATANTLVKRDPSGNFEAGYPTADAHVATKAYVDTQVVDLGQYVGNHDASGGLVPTTGSGTAGAIRAGDMWNISVAGSISGLTPITDVAVGDVLIASINGATTGSQFIAIQRNIPEPTTSTSKYAETVTLLSDVDNVITHNLGTTDVIISVHRTSDSEKVYVKEVISGVNTVTLTASNVGAGMSVRVVVVG